MALQLGDTAPDFPAATTAGEINFHQWAGNDWVILFSHPKDFTPVCTTELGHVARLKPEFDRRGVKAIGLSADSVDSHRKWADDIRETQGYALNFPLIADPDRKIARLYGMIHPEHDELYTVRTVFVIDPKKKIRLTITYPLTAGRDGIHLEPAAFELDRRDLGSRLSLSPAQAREPGRGAQLLQGTLHRLFFVAPVVLLDAFEALVPQLPVA